MDYVISALVVYCLTEYLFIKSWHDVALQHK